MRSLEYGTPPTHVPAFLTKLWKLVTDVSCDDLISWSLGGTSFIIYDEIRFSKELLPMYFKHNNMASFVRQLNMYGFRKLSCIDQGGMHCYKSEIEFYHQYFNKGNESTLELIKRKIPNSKSEEPKVKQEYIEELISSIKTLRGKHDRYEHGMKYLRTQNRMLWNNVNALVAQSSKQQAVLQQLVPFFMSMVRSRQEVTMKRKAPLMIDEGDMKAKLARLSPPYYVETSNQDPTSTMPSSPGNVTNRGPVIHDVTELESNKMFLPDTILCSPNTATKECEAIVDSPLSCSLESSEQTNDSPYSEPGSVETLNILNHNFERSNSLSPRVDMKHSPVNAASPFHFPSQVCAMPTSQSSVSNYSSGSRSSIPPVANIDETTSDVPMMKIVQGSFVPKIEDTCSNSAMYTMNSMMNDATSIMNSRTPLINEATVTGQGTSSMMNEGAASGSSENKFFPNGFPSSFKSPVSDAPWMLNQDPFGNEPNIENWLGQIFKSDNLVAGCSLPQQQST